MSLDVYLRVASPQATSSRRAIFIREDGQTREITREEWEQRYPGIEPASTTIATGGESHVVFEYNITHNLGRMADEAGIYEALWRPDELQITRADQLVPHLQFGLHNLREDPDRFKALNPDNGWGTYEGLVRFVEKYLQACIDHPTSIIEASR